MKIDIDESDRIILDHLQNDATTPLKALVEKTGLSIASVQRRIRRLRESGLIEREVAQLSAEAMGQDVTFIVTVELHRESLEQLENFQRRVVKDPHVQQCYYVTGEADFVLICITPDMKAFEELTHRLFFENSNVRKFHTSVVMKRAKVGLSIPVW